MKLHVLVATYFALITATAFSMEKSVYDFKWLDDNEQVYVIQNKEFKKTGRFAADVGLAQSENSPYYDSLGLFLMGTYHISENYSFDLTYKKYSNSKSQDLDNLLEANTTQTKPLLTSVESAALFHFNWIPFYGKLNVFNQILYFDLGLGAGLGRFNIKNNFKTFNVANMPLKLEDESHNGLSTKIFFNFFTNSNVTFGFAYNLSTFKTIRTPSGGEEYYYYVDFLANVGYLF